MSSDVHFQRFLNGDVVPGGGGRMQGASAESGVLDVVRPTAGMTVRG